MGETKEMIKSLFGSLKKAENPNDKGKEYERQHRRDSYSSRSHSPEPKPLLKERKRRKNVVVSVPDPVSIPKSDPNASIISPTMEAPDWPPGHLKRDDSVDMDEANEVIAAGAPIFKGFRSAIPNVPGDLFNFYAIADMIPGDGYDAAVPFHAAFSLQSFLFSGMGGSAQLPWQTLEQPSLAFSYGNRPGTITLNHWVGLFGFLDPVFDFIEPSIKLRNLELETIIARLQYIEGGFEENYPELMYTNLYGSKGVLKDPDRYTIPHKAIEAQIADLITILGRKDWIDYSRPENWVVGKLFKDVRLNDRGRGYKFFHQLLVSMELDVRICSKLNEDTVRQKLMAQLPAPIAYSVAVARRWREGVRIDKIVGGDKTERIRYTFRIKKQQLKSIRKFARLMRWKNLEEVESVLEHRDRLLPRVEELSSDAMTYVSGVIVPGPSLPWLLINTLIDCDSETDHQLDKLTHLHPHAGFQYKGSTYWSSSSIVGKVLAPTAQEIGGWIGPCLQTPDLKRTEVARLRQRRPLTKLEVRDIRTMEIRSDPLGPESTSYPLDEYEMVIPDTDLIGESVKIEKLSFKKLSRYPKEDDGDRAIDDSPSVYDASIQFAIDGQSWPLMLSFNTEYISAYPCESGPHPLFYDYKYRATPVANVLSIKDWGNSSTSQTSHKKHKHKTSTSSSSSAGEEESEKVLVIEAFGLPDNEVLARAYCSHWKLSAVVADVSRTCMACAVREAYAACVRVCILVGPHLGGVEG